MYILPIIKDYITQYNLTLGKFRINKKYEFYKDYILTSMDDILNNSGINTLFNNDYSYGIITNIYNTNIFVLDIDVVPRTIEISNILKSQVDYIRKYNDIKCRKGGDWNNNNTEYIQKKLNSIIDFYFNIFGNKILASHTFISSKLNSNNYNQYSYHMYFILNDNYDIAGVYNHPMTKNIACKGYLSFTINGGYSNIRITNKVTKNNDKDTTIKEILNLRRIK